MLHIHWLRTYSNEHRNWRKCSGGAEGRGWSGEQWGRLKHQGNIVSWHAALTNFFMAFFSNCEMLTGRLALLHRLALWSARHTADCGESVQKMRQKQFRLRASQALGTLHRVIAGGN